MNAPSQLPEARKEQRSLEAYLLAPKTIEGIRSVAGKYLRPDRMLRLVTNSLRKVPKLAQCDPQSFLGSVMMSAALELEPNTPQGLAYLIPYDKRGKMDNGKWGVIGTECQFIIGYRGYIELAYRNPNIVKFIGRAVHENDDFDYCEGSETFLRFKIAMQDRGPLIGAFSYAQYQTPSGAKAEMILPMPLEDVHKARSKSETYNFLVKQLEEAEAKSESQWKIDSARKKLAETPWVMWEDDMAAKTPLRKMAKVIPMGGSYSAAADLDEAAESRTLDLTAMADPSLAKAVASGEEMPPLIEHIEEEEIQPLAEVITNSAQQKEPVRTARQANQAKAAAQQQTAQHHDPDTGEVFDEAAAALFGKE